MATHPLWSKCNQCPIPEHGPLTSVDYLDNLGNRQIKIIKQPFTPNWKRYSEIVQNTHNKKLVKVRTELNGFGRWNGAPHGYGQPPKNTF